jgi:SNF2 family DNA or RNA helicase
LQQLLHPQATLRLKKKSSVENSFIRLDDLLSFDWQVAVGKEVLSPSEFNRLLQSASSLIKFKENYIYVDGSDIEKLHKIFTKETSLSPIQLLQTALLEEYELAPVVLTDEVRSLIKEFKGQEKIRLPQELNAQLRPYQERGFSWLYRNMRIGFGSILADDMGLGKTLQVITLLLKIKEEGMMQKEKALIVTPTGLLINWQAEIERFAPSISTFIYHGTARNLKFFDADVMLTTYGVLRSDALLLKREKWQVMVIDEAQNIKNQDTAQSKAIRSIPAGTHIALSGTPVENRLSEFWSIMDFANKGYLGNIKSFKSEYAQPIQVFNDMQCVQRFRKITAPFMMRRLKSDKSIIADLPDKIEQNEYALLTQPQAALYDRTLQVAMNEIEGIKDSDHESLFKRQGLVLQMILALKQICNHPTQFLKNGLFNPALSGKTEMLLDLVESIVDSSEKVLIFTQFREMGEMLQLFLEERLGERPMFYHGGCSLKERQTMVDRFQNNRADKVFLLSLRAAGTGLNLTAASHVIHYDLWWNPAVEAQATDRAYRIGQNKNVMVHRFITKNTFEERIDDMIQKKKNLANLTVTSGESWIGKLSNKELREVFGGVK